MRLLGEIAELITGMTLRSRPKSVPGGLVRLMQLGDFDPSGAISFATMIRVDREPEHDRYVIRAGDLVFRGRGAGIAACVVPQHTGEIAVVAPLIVIRPQRERVDPAYLEWFLGTQDVRRHLERHMRGSLVMGIGKADLQNVEVPLPDMETQRAVGELERLRKREGELVERYQSLRERLFDRLLSDLVRDGGNNPERKGRRQ